MKDTQSKVHIENINNYLMLAPLPLRGGVGGKQKGEPDNDSNLQKDVYIE